MYKCYLKHIAYVMTTMRLPIEQMQFFHEWVLNRKAEHKQQRETMPFKLWLEKRYATL